jgi:C-terminal processing protease CtpA/Prc
LGLTFKSPAYNFASFSYEQNLWIVELVTQGGPASGIVHVGDQITSIDGWTFDDKSNDKSIDKLCLGRPGTEAVLNIRRPDVDKILDVTLTR